MTKPEEIISEIKKDYIMKLAKQGKRVDGRGLNDYRNISIETNYIPRAEGSAYVKLGNTQLIVGIKAEVGEPFPDTPNSGVLTTNIELIPLAHPTFESGPPGEDAVELARVVDRGIRESRAINVEKLVIEEGKKVWIIFVDIHVLDYDGNLFDAAGLGAISALMNTQISGERFQLDLDFKLPIEHYPIPITTIKIGDLFMVDPTLEEELAADAIITVTPDENGDIRAMQKGFGSFYREEIEKIINTSKEIALALNKKYLQR
jgi:exosome complex component RRP42